MGFGHVDDDVFACGSWGVDLFLKFGIWGFLCAEWLLRFFLVFGFFFWLKEFGFFRLVRIRVWVRLKCYV
jgi:hypothetical protein